MKKINALLLGLFTVFMATMPVFAAGDGADTSLLSAKAIAAAMIMMLAAAAGAIAMAIAVGKSAEGIARQPEASGQIRTTMMMGLVFIETAIIYALIVAILIIFVL